MPNFGISRGANKWDEKMKKKVNRKSRLNIKSKSMNYSLRK